MNVTRQRRRREGSPALSDIFASKRLRLVAAAGCALAIGCGGIAAASTAGFGNNKVGSTDSAGNLQISDNQQLKPLGDRLMTKFGKIMGSTISPNGKIVAATSTDRSIDVQMFNLDSYKLVSAAGTLSADGADLAAVAAGAPFSTDGKTAAFAYTTTAPGQATLPTNATAADACKSGGTLLDGTTGQGNPTFSPDGSKLYVPVSCGFDVYNVDANGVLSAPTSIFLPAVTAAHPIITGTANPISYTNIEYPLTAGSVFGSNGHLYAALNGQNAVDEIDPATGSVVNHWDVDVAPRQLAFVGGKLYVTNEGGVADESGQQSYGTRVKSSQDGTTTTGTVSVIDPSNAAAAPTRIDVGLHPTALYANGSTLYVANTNDDTVSVIDTTTDKVVQTISTQPWRTGSKVGYQPDALDVVNNHLLVSLGRANAIDVFALGTTAQDPPREIGLLPTDYYPSGVFTDATGKIVVANRRGVDARAADVTISEGQNTAPATGHGTHSTTASLTRFALPADTAVAGQTAVVFKQNGWSADAPVPATTEKTQSCKTVTKKVKLHGKALKKAKKHHKKHFKTVHKRVCSTVSHSYANPIPQRIGAKSGAIKHVFLIVKENRTYDQVYGDMKQGNGDASMAQFGANVTPNQHALAAKFGLYDNTYDIGTNSSEGHDWLMMGDNPEYNESSAGEYTRSYDTEEDVLGHQRTGFLWTAIQAAGNTARNYGEFLYGEGKPDNTKTDSPTWQQYYCATTAYTTAGDASQLDAGPLKSHYGSPIPSLNAITDPASPSYDLSIPDIYREAVWEQDFKSQLANAAGADKGVPNFNMIWYSDDHTGSQATPGAQVADNDLAVGRMVDKISHSPVWKDSVIFVAEDDSQNGVDHVDGHRAPIQVISPWAQHGKVIDTYYSQINMVRTIEQILGAAPLNQKVAAATPMYGAFTGKPDYSTYKAVTNKVPLTEGLSGGAPACGNDTLGQTGTAARRITAAAAKAVAVPASEQSVATAWDAWATQQHFAGPGAVADYANPELMDRYTWYRAHDWSTPYPGDTRILAPSQVAGAYVPNADSN